MTSRIIYALPYILSDSVEPAEVEAEINRRLASHTSAADPHTQYLLESGYTAADILTKLLTVDGAGSGLDADLLDGNSSAHYLPAASFVPPGSDTHVLFNDGGAFGADAGLTYAKATDRLTVAGGLVAPSMRPASNSTTALQWQNAAGAAVVTADTTNGRMGIGVTPSESLHTSGNLKIDGIFVYLNGNLFANANGSTDIILGSNLGRNFYFRTASGANRLAMLSASGHVGVGLNPIPLTQFDCQDTNAGTGAVQNAITMRSTNSGTPGTGFGVGFRAGLKSSTTDNSAAGRLTWEWTTATHASRASRGKLTAFYTTTEQEAVTWDGDTGGLKLGFYGVTPVARQVLATGAGASVDDVITALQNLGLVKQS